MHYAHNKNPSFAAARVTKNSLTLKYYQVTHDENTRCYTSTCSLQRSQSLPLSRAATSLFSDLYEMKIIIKMERMMIQVTTYMRVL